MKIPFGQLNDVWEVHNNPGPHSPKPELSFIIILDHPGIYHRKLSDITATFTESLTWKEADTWIRQTRMNYEASQEMDTPTNLQIAGDIMDIGELTFDLVLVT